ncbi:WecB/TagA/CpsF family glycosyltransferase [Sphingobium aquiterrae]|uniref:WecB/TagA/CpsF family glycosyltransferase n=1 Tax=Sphingobium aquiterrae TaxID=2038656 RepID=UPI00301799F0
MPERFYVLGVPVSVTSPDRCLEDIVRWSSDNFGRFICMRDVHGVMRARRDAELARAHDNAAIVAPDGAPLALIGKFRGLPVKRTTGPDLMDMVMDKGRQTGLRHYLYGGTPGVADQLKTVFEARYPGCRIVGTYCPPFRPLTEDEEDMVLQDIADSDAQLVWVGLSTPKQELWMLRTAARTETTMIGVGAAFDFHTARIKRAPLWMRNCGLEWAHRLWSEPRRLWQRYLVLAPLFVFLVLFGRDRKG